MIDFDVLLAKVGGFNKYQFRTAAVVGYYGIFIAQYSLASIFTSVNPDFKCNFGQSDFSSNPVSGISTEGVPSPNITNECEFPATWCDQGLNCTKATNVSAPFCPDGMNQCPDDMKQYHCTSFIFDQSDWTATTITDWKLVCQRAYSATYPDTMYYAGQAVSMVLMGSVSDVYGRQRTCLLCQIILVIFSFAQLAAADVATFSFIRFVQGFVVSSGYAAAFVYLTEIVDSEKRAKLGLSINSMFGLGSIAYALAAYVLRDWRHLVTWVSVNSTIACVGIFFLGESPRWLFTKDAQRREYGKQVTYKIADVNGRTITEEDFEEADCRVESQKTETVSLLTLFSIGCVAKVTLIQWFMWAAIAMAYYGISLGVQELAGDIFVNTVLMGVMEVSAVTILMFTMDNLSRRKATMYTFVISGVCYLLTGFLEHFGEESSSAQMASTAFAVAGKFFSSGCYSCIYVYSAELYPTSCRNTGFASVVLASRLASIIVPYIVEVGKNSVPWLPPLLFGSSCVVSGGLCWLLPDTQGIPLMETLEEAVKFYQNPETRKPGDVKLSNS